ncbi:hypothetical protein K435DRAFT_805937 [Dendrothele bispora CBS 962.96]|uniref:Uncharacterized protein n=1 Tax=Dendrothele bispora (strain CBS 962.96) TaxID=1314807 RepID=A0A4S8L9W5_DENBC|nr:hypothetical protein K435DRAFT_805937 [Dendrothele bispora CBS 962.96]
MLRTEEFPPFHPGQLTDEEKSLLRRSTKEIFIQEIRCYETRHRDIGHGFNHDFGPLQIDFGTVDWANVERVYRICYNSDHRDRNSPCTLQWLSEPLPPRLRKQLNSNSKSSTSKPLTNKPAFPKASASSDIQRPTASMSNKRARDESDDEQPKPKKVRYSSRVRMAAHEVIDLTQDSD